MFTPKHIEDLEEVLGDGRFSSVTIGIHSNEDGAISIRMNADGKKIFETEECFSLVEAFDDLMYEISTLLDGERL
jgi:hypothetical protein